MNIRAERLVSNINSGEAFLITSRENIFYLSGFTGEGMLIIDKQHRIIVTDFRYIEAAEMNTCGFCVENIARGIENIIPPTIKTLLIEENHLTLGRYRAYQKKLAGIELADSSSLIEPLRLIKDESELANIKTAAQIATEAFKKVLLQTKAGISERQLSLTFEHLVKSMGASAVSFDTIVASGKNSSMPHAVACDKELQNGDFVTFDFGCVYNGYCSDMTRTVAIGSVTDKQKNVYETVLKAQKTALNAAVSGASCFDVDKTARDIITKAGYGKEFGHALGHGVGIEVHEQPTLSPKSTKTLENGMVVTIEPGIYIENEFGVRIEDLIIINKEKPINLSDFTKELIIL